MTAHSMTRFACALAVCLAVAVPVASATPASPAKSAPREPGMIRTIVLDPGHGGEEVGAVGRGGVLEKDLCLDIAKRLAERLSRLPDTTVLLTREDDRVVPLRERTAIANHAKADLFVSIHMNSSRRLSAHGTEAYFLALTASDEEAMSLAHAENTPPAPLPGTDGDPNQPPDPNAPNAPNAPNVASGAAEGGAADAAQNDLDLVLWGMAQSEHIVSSSRLADVIQDEMNRLLKVDSRGVKQAPFTVLMGATMPAVLVEVAFLSNDAEEKLLVTSEFKDKVADALHSAIVRFKDETEKALSAVPTTDGHTP